MSSPEKIIAELGYYCASVHGYSMYPLLINHRDSVYIKRKPRYDKYDVVLFRRTDGQLVLHRLINIKNGNYICSGDNDRVLEAVDPRSVIGYMAEFSRNGSIKKADSFLYKAYGRIWAFSMPTKRLLQFVCKCTVACKNKFSRK
jgi:hypothetical protein